MAEYTRSDKQSEAWIDPAARAGIKRFMGSQDAEQLAGFVRDCLRAIDRPAAVMIFNKHVLGIPMPSSSDRGRIGSMLRDVLRVGRPDAFECLQNLTSYHLEKSLGDDHYEPYSTAVDQLNEAAEDGGTKKINAAAKAVVAAMRAAMDDDAIRRYVRLHALPETLDALLKAVAKAPAAAAATDAEADGESVAVAATADKAKKSAGSGKQAGAGRTSGRATEKKTPAKRATRGAGKATPAKRKAVRRSGGG